MKSKIESIWYRNSWSIHLPWKGHWAVHIFCWNRKENLAKVAPQRFEVTLKYHNDTTLYLGSNPNFLICMSYNNTPYRTCNYVFYHFITWFYFHSKNLCSHTHLSMVCLWQETQIPCQDFIKTMPNFRVSVIISFKNL